MFTLKIPLMIVFLFLACSEKGGVSDRTGVSGSSGPSVPKPSDSEPEPVPVSEAEELVDDTDYNDLPAASSEWNFQELEPEEAEHSIPRPPKPQSTEPLTNEQKISLIEQCLPNYLKQLESSASIYERIRSECFAENSDISSKTGSLVLDLKYKLDNFKTENLTAAKYASGERSFIEIMNEYKKLQNTLSYCRTQRVLTGEGPTPDGKLFLHAIGDIFGVGSGLEGDQQKRTIPYRTKMLRTIQQQLDGRTYIQDKEQVTPCVDARFELLSSQASPRPDISQKLLKKLIKQSEDAEDFMTAFDGGDLEKIRQKIVEQLSKTRREQSIFLPAGWTKHAVLYQFTRQKNDQIALRIYNSGEGIATYHAKLKYGYQTKFFPFVEIRDIDRYKITSFIFLKALQEIARPGVYNSEPQDFYERLLAALDGKAKQVEYNASLFRDPQQSGTCTYYPTSWLLESSIGQFNPSEGDNETAAQIEFFISAKTLANFGGQKTDWDEAGLSLLRKGLVFVSESTARNFQNDIIDEGALLSVANLGDQVKITVEKADDKIAKIQSQNAPSFEAAKFQEAPLRDLANPLEKTQEIRSGGLHVEAQLPYFDLKQELSLLYKNLESHAVKPLPAPFNHQLEFNSDYAETVINAIEKLALQLPLDTSYWAPKNAAKSIEALSNISQLYLYVLLNQVREKQRAPDKISAVSYLTTLKLLTVADLINRKLVHDIKPAIPSMYQPRAGLILSGKTSILETFDPAWQEQVKKMRQYYKPEETQQESFFGFEEYPAGTRNDVRKFYDDPQAEGASGYPYDNHWSYSRQYSWLDFKWAKNYIELNRMPLGDADGIPTPSNMPSGYHSVSIKPFEYSCDILGAKSCRPPPSLGTLSYSWDSFHSIPRTNKTILLNRRTILALSDDTLPKIFRDLRVLSVVSDFMLSGRFIDDWSQMTEKSEVNSIVESISQIYYNKGIGVSIKIDQKTLYGKSGKYVCSCVPEGDSSLEKKIQALERSEANKYSLGYDIFGILFQTRGRQPIEVSTKKAVKDFALNTFVSPWKNLFDGTRPFVKYGTEFPQKSHWAELLQIWSEGQNRALELLDPNISPIRYRVEPNEYILKKPTDRLKGGDSFARLSLERMRNLMGISAIPELQIKATLDFFSKYPELFLVPEYQVLFEKLMMEPALLQDQFRISNHDSELLAQKLADFCDTRLENFKKYFDYKGIAFTLHMKQLFYEEARFSNVPDSVAQLLSGAPEALFSAIKELKNEQLNEKSFLARNLAEMFLYSTTLSQKDAGFLLFAAIEFKNIQQQDKEYLDPFAERSIQNLLIKQQDNLHIALNDRALDFVIDNLRPGRTRLSPHWIGKGSIFTAEFGLSANPRKFQIDISSGDIYDSGNPQVLFPLEVSEFQKVFGKSNNAPTHATRIGIDTYEWSDSKAQKIGNSWTFQKKIGDVWYQYLDESDLRRLGDTKLVLEGFHYWRSIQAQPTVIKILSDDGKLKYEARISGHSLESFIRFSDGSILVNAKPDSDYKVFEQIESWNHIYIWKNPKNNEIIEVELPRLKIQFKRSGSDMVCANYEAYKIAKKQYISELGSPINYLACDSTSSSRKLILSPPNQLEPFKSSDGKYIETLAPIFRTIFNSHYVLTYEDSSLSGFQSTTEESQYYLALRKLFQRKYREAASIIKSTSIELRPLEPDEQKIVKWLIEGNPIDSDPRSYAVRLLAAYWNLKHEQYYEGVFNLPPAELYVKYLQNVQKIDANILGIFEEENLANLILASTDGDPLKPLAQARLSQLTQEASNQRFSPLPVVLESQEGSIKYPKVDYSLFDYQKLFNQKYSKPTIDQQAALRPQAIICEQTFPLFYKIASGEHFNRDSAIQLLQLAIGIKAESLNNVQIRNELMTLIKLSALNGSKEAAFLVAVHKRKISQKEMLSVKQIQKLFKNLHENLNKKLEDYFLDINKQSDKKAEPISVSISQDGYLRALVTQKSKIPEATEDIKMAELPLGQIAQEDPLKEPLFNETQIKQALEIRTLNQSEIQKITSKTEELQKNLDRSKNKAVQELNRKISVYSEKFKASKRFYGNVQWQKFKATNTRAKQTELEQLRKDILELGQRYAPAFEGGGVNRILHLADIGTQINLNDLIYILLKRNIVALHQVQGALKLDELNKLYENLIRYLMLSTYLDHVGRLKARLEAASRVCRSSEQTEACQIELAAVVNLGTETRHYRIEDHVEYLVFEYFMKLLIRPEQIEALDLLKIKNGQMTNPKPLGGLLELIMGAGKTSVLLPLLSTLNTTEGMLNIIVLPEALIASTSPQISKQLSSSFSRGAMVLHVSRQRYLYERDLRLFYERLDEARKQNKTVITTNSSIQSLFLSFIDRLSRYNSEPSLVKGEIGQFYKIFRFLRQYGNLTIDEVDLALDILQTHQFSVGIQQPLVHSPVLKSIPVAVFSLYQEIATNLSLHQELDFPFLHQRGKNAFTAGAYENFKPRLIDAILKPGFLRVSEEFNKPYNAFVKDSALQALAKKYLLSESLAERNNLFRAISDERIKNIFAVLYEDINHVLPLTAVRKIGVHYGPLPEPLRFTTETQANYDARLVTYKNSRLIAIPYHSGEPMPNSRFGTPLESLNYALQLALYQKGYRYAVEQEIKALKKMILERSSNLVSGVFKRRLENLVGPGQEFNVMQVTSKNIEEITKRIQETKNLQVQLELNWLYVIPQVRFNKRQLTTNAQIYESLFKRIQGFSGTLWSFETFPKIFNLPVFSDTTEKTFFILWQDYWENKNPLLVLKSTSRDGYLKEIYSNQFKGSLMDEAGIFRGSSNKKIANSIRLNANKTVAFYDELNNLVACCDSNNQSMVLENNNSRPDLVAFWDKKHTTGSDIKLSTDMKAAMTFDFHINSRGLQQTVWRLRGLGSGQQVVIYAALKEDLSIIRERLKNEFEVEPEDKSALGDLLLYSVLNQDKKLGELKFRAMKQKMRNIVITKVLNQIFYEGRSSEVIYSIYARSRALFERHFDEQPYTYMGIPIQEQELGKILEVLVSNIENSDYIPQLDRHEILSKINRLIQIETPSLPRMVRYSEQENESEVEIETETEQEQEQEREQEEEKEDFSTFAAHKPHAIFHWNLSSVSSFNDEFFIPIPIRNFSQSMQIEGTPIVSLKSAFRADELNALSRTISDNFLVSLNFAPVHHQNRILHDLRLSYEFEFFGPYHKQVQDVLLIQNKDSQKFRFILIDENDAREWDEFLRNHRDSRGENKIALYNLSTNKIYREGADHILETDIPVEMLVQAGFLAGRVNYPKNQLPALKVYLETGDTRELLKTFQAYILRYKRDTQKAFRGSDLEQIFIELLGSAD